MVEFDPLPPVHPSWPSRPVPEEGDEKGRYPHPPKPETRDEDQDKEPGSEQETPSHPPADDSTGRNIDEYV
jgi:hypothetical protein